MKPAGIICLAVLSIVAITLLIPQPFGMLASAVIGGTTGAILRKT